MKLGGWALVAVVVGGVVLQAEAAAAQEPAPAAPADAAPDIVRLKNGGLLRGTISELVPGETVVIVTASGKTREIPMAEVEYAGPANQDPKASSPAAPKNRADDANEGEDIDAGDREVATTSEARPYVTVQAGKARLSLKSEPAGLTFHRQTGAATAGGVSAIGFDRLCTAPCKIEIPAGTEQLSLSKEDGNPVKSKAVTIPEGESTIVGRYEDNSGNRIGAFLCLLVGAGGGSALMVSGIHADGIDGARIGIGGAVLGGGLLLGGILFSMGADEAKFEVRPRRSAALSWPKATTFSVRSSL